MWTGHHPAEGSHSSEPRPAETEQVQQAPSPTETVHATHPSEVFCCHTHRHLRSFPGEGKSGHVAMSGVNNRGVSSAHGSHACHGDCYAAALGLEFPWDRGGTATATELCHCLPSLEILQRLPRQNTEVAKADLLANK